MGKTAVIKGKEVHYSDCCNPGLSADEKQMCKFAAEDDDRTRWDVAGNKYVYVWSGCEVGKEPWRKWD